jgi:TRAP-type C4-dicarboxylate transport system permease small subunit
MLVRAPEGPKLETAVASDPMKSRTRKALGFVAHEPLFQFIALGLLIWGGVEYWHACNDYYTIGLLPIPLTPPSA